MENLKSNNIILGLILGLSLILSTLLLGNSFINVREMDRTVTVKGLSEKEVKADIAIWPLKFSTGENDLTLLYQNLESKTQRIKSFLKKMGFEDQEITINAPSIHDKLTARYGGQQNYKFRYTADRVLSVYSSKIDLIIKSQQKLVELVSSGIAISASDYDTKPQYLFNGLNNLKPQMIEEATKKAREVAIKFAEDSGSQLGKIKKARQGQFSIVDRDSNTPQIKKVRVVSTVEYYLAD